MKPNASQPDTIIDARGHRCPVPTLKLRRWMETALPGTLVSLRADDPLAQIDVPHFCNQNNYVLETVDVENGTWIFYIRR